MMIEQKTEAELLLEKLSNIEKILEKHTYLLREVQMKTDSRMKIDYHYKK